MCRSVEPGSPLGAPDGRRGTADGAEVVNLDVLDNLWLLWFVVAGALLVLWAWRKRRG